MKYDYISILQTWSIPLNQQSGSMEFQEITGPIGHVKKYRQKIIIVLSAW